tara:strand:- start:327 stop:572 length:246 start_codon:yes stop_codon:yes gene_type:complete
MRRRASLPISIPAPGILTSSDRCAATSSIKEEEETSRTIAIIALLFLDGRGVTEGDGAGDGLAVVRECRGTDLITGLWRLR